MNPFYRKRHELEEWIKLSLNSHSSLSFVPLKGATSATVYQVCTSSGGRYVLRLFTNHNWLQEEPDLAEHEAAILNKAHQARLPVPELVAYTSDTLAFGVPAVLMGYIDGAVNLKADNFNNWIKQLAVTLANIHAIDANDVKWSYSSWNTVQE